jgi:lysine 2,3-aminomutase
MPQRVFKANVRGPRTTAICETARGGGKRDIHSYEHYDPQTGISISTAPGVKPGRRFVYVDPLSQLDDDARRRWDDEFSRHRMVQRALEASQISSGATSAL